jgi:hypothetical protein
MIIALYSAKGGGRGKPRWRSISPGPARPVETPHPAWDPRCPGRPRPTSSARASGGRQGGAQHHPRSDPSKLIRHTAIDRLDLLPADASLRDLEHAFHDLGKRKRLAKAASHLTGDYDRDHHRLLRQG